MRARLLKPADYLVMHWKNGGGVTKQLLMEPEGANLEEGFKWRISLSEICCDGPFSFFPDCQRTTLLLEGNGCELSFSNHGGKRLEKLFDSVSFSGDWQTNMTLNHGPCRDFNVISAKGVQHRLSILRPEPRAIIPKAPITILFCARGSAKIAPTGVTISQEETLRLDESEILEASSLYQILFYW